MAAGSSSGSAPVTACDQLLGRRARQQEKARRPLARVPAAGKPARARILRGRPAATGALSRRQIAVIQGVA
jgi:hypothetical protein